MAEELPDKTGAASTAERREPARPSRSVDPNVREGKIIAYEIAKDGHRVCVTDYLDDAIGMVKMWAGDFPNQVRSWCIDSCVKVVMEDLQNSFSP